MTKTGQNVVMHKGDTKNLVATITDSSDAYVNLSGSEMNYVVYRQNPFTAVITKTTASGISFTNPTVGVLEISLDPLDTENLLGNYLHELEMTDVSGNISTLFTGSFTVLDSKA